MKLPRIERPIERLWERCTAIGQIHATATSGFGGHNDRFHVGRMAGSDDRAAQSALAQFYFSLSDSFFRKVDRLMPRRLAAATWLSFVTRSAAWINARPEASIIC